MEQHSDTAAAHRSSHASSMYSSTATGAGIATGRGSSLIYKLKHSQNLWPLIQGMSVLIWMFSMAGNFHCSFLMVQQLVVETLSTSAAASNATTVEIVDHPVGLGLFSTSVYDMEADLLGCVSYYGSSDQFDGAFRAARTFGVISALSTSIALICVTLVTLFIEPLALKDNLWSVARFLFFAAFLCQLLTFLAFGRDLCNRTDMECRPGPASVLSIFNLFLLCAQSALIYVVPPVASPFFLRLRNIPSSAIDMVQGSSNNNNNNNNKKKDNVIDDQSEKFEILSIQPSTPAHQVVETEKHEGGGVATNSDLESECGAGLKIQKSTPTIVMEGIECVAADHLRREPKSPWEQFTLWYYGIGKRPGFRTLTAVGLGLSWIFTLVETTRCTFILVGATGQDRNEFSGLGLFNRAYYVNDDILGCIAYPSSAKSDFDGAFEVGRAFGMMTLLLVTASFISFCILHAFIESSPRKELAWWSLTQLTLPCALLAQFITFAALKTQACTRSDNVDCVAGMAGVFGILNVFLVAPLAIFIFALPCPTKPFFQMRNPPSREPRQRTIESQAKRLREYVQQQKAQKQKQTQTQLGDGYHHPESSTHSVSDHSAACVVGSEDGVRVQSFCARDEGVEQMYNTSINEEPSKKSSPTNRETQHANGATLVTTIVDDYNLEDCPSSTNARMEEPTGTSVASGWQTTTEGIETTVSWDYSLACEEQFETVEMDTSVTGSSSPPYRKQPSHSISSNTNTTVKTTPQDMQNASKCCLVQQTAMTILKEMQEEEERKQRESHVQSALQPPLVRSFAMAKSETVKTTNTSIQDRSFESEPSPVLLNGPPSSAKKSKPAAATTSENTSSKASQTQTQTVTTRGGLTTRGGRAYPRSATSADAIGIHDPDDDTLEDDDFFANAKFGKFGSKVSSTDYCPSTSEDDGHTFNTGEYAINNESVAAHYRREKHSKP